MYVFLFHLVGIMDDHTHARHTLQNGTWQSCFFCLFFRFFSLVLLIPDGALEVVKCENSNYDVQIFFWYPMNAEDLLSLYVFREFWISVLP